MEGIELILGRSRSLDCQRKTPDLGVPEFSVIPRVHVAHAKADFFLGGGRGWMGESSENSLDQASVQHGLNFSGIQTGSNEGGEYRNYGEEC